MASKRQKKKQAFQSTLPVWGGTWCFLSGLIFYLYFNPPSPCGEGLLNPVNMCSFVAISIHPPRVGRDGGIWGTTETTIPISIHPPRVGRDSGSGEAPAGPAGISIHPPRVGRDVTVPPIPAEPQKFQSTLPVWGGTKPFSSQKRAKSYFNPPSPCGEGRQRPTFREICLPFQSTLPVWGGTPKCPTSSTHRPISIHPPRVGRDNPRPFLSCIHFLFQSTLPVWGGTHSFLSKAQSR